MSSNVSLPPVSGSTIISGVEATQLLQRLRGSNNGGNSQAIKIQTVQTVNTQSGVRQIIAIPIQTTASSSASSSAMASKISVSPLKTKPQQAQFGPNVKVVKLASSAASSMITTANNPTVTGIQTTAASTGYNIQMANQMPTTQSKQQQKQQNMNYPSPLLDTGSRKRSDIDFDSFSDAKRRKSEKGGKGLRHFSMKVCEKVQAKGSTSYNEVADELVAELTDPRCTSPTDQQYDQKNIRRRVYDALNVLMAMNIISKEKKEIRWLGLPTNSIQEANSLESDKARRMERIKAKTQQLQDLILQQIAFKNLVERNKEREKSEGAPAPNSAIQLPFIIVNTSKKTVIDCSISNDKMEYLFNFDDTFEIHDDMEVLKRMGLGFGLENGTVTSENLEKARQMVPRALEQYVVQLAQSGPGKCIGMPQVTDLNPALVKREFPSNSLRGGSDKRSADESDIDVN